jgi:hypothetical protein
MTIDYRLAPQWLYPSPEEDVSAAVDWLRSQTFVAAVGMFGVSSTPGATRLREELLPGGPGGVSTTRFATTSCPR